MNNTDLLIMAERVLKDGIAALKSLEKAHPLPAWIEQAQDNMKFVAATIRVSALKEDSMTVKGEVV